MAPAGPSPEEVRAQVVSQLLSAGNPYVPGQVNLTVQMQLEAIDPQAAAAQQAQA